MNNVKGFSTNKFETLNASSRLSQKINEESGNVLRDSRSVVRV